MIKLMCICDEGWSSLGDLAVTEGIDCDLNKGVLHVLHWIVLIFELCLALLSARVFYFRFALKPDVRDHQVLCSMSFLASSVTGACYSVIKIVSSQAIIGNGVAVRFFSLSFFFFMALGFMTFIVIISNFFKGSLRALGSAARTKIEKVTAFQEKSLPRMLPVVLATSYLPMIGILFPDIFPSFATVSVLSCLQFKDRECA
jgi:hypothetical protein